MKRGLRGRGFRSQPARLKPWQELLVISQESGVISQESGVSPANYGVGIGKKDGGSHTRSQESEVRSQGNREGRVTKKRSEENGEG